MDALTIAVAALISQLGADDFRAREAAHRTLAKLGPVAIRQLEHTENSTCRERSCRARQIVNDWYAARAGEYLAVSIPGKAPWIAETASVSYDELRTYLDMAHGLGAPCNPPEWDDYRLASRLLLEDRLRQRKSHEAVAKSIRELIEAERKWIAENPHYRQGYDPRPVAGMQ